MEAGRRCIKIPTDFPEEKPQDEEQIMHNGTIVLQIWMNLIHMREIKYYFYIMDKNLTFYMNDIYSNSFTFCATILLSIILELYRKIGKMIMQEVNLASVF